MVNDKPYDKLTAPEFPSSWRVKNWILVMCSNLCNVGGYIDQAGVAWLQECETKSYDELADGGSERFRKADMAMNKVLTSLISKSNQPIKNDLVINNQEARMANRLIAGRQIV